MKSGMIKKLLASVMVSMFVINGITVTKVDANVKSEENVKVSIEKLNPKPINLEVGQDIVTLTSTVNVKGLEVADTDAVNILKEFLKENNITINENHNEASTTIIIGEANDNIDGIKEVRNNLGALDPSSLKAEGYVLATSSEGAGTILIQGKDEDGTFYGVKTLEQLLVSMDSKVYSPEVVISDEPTMTTRGIVEGFFGNPWSHEDRVEQLSFYGDYKMNTYIYDAKDDPYHRAKWREPYPQEQMDELRELTELANKSKVDFVFTLAPGIDIALTGETAESDFQILMEKFEAAYDLGIRRFGIFWDDVDNADAKRQAELLNRFNDEFVKAKGDVKPLITVPKEYDTGEMVWGGQAKPYTRVFADTLDKDIDVMWTGPGVVPEGITVPQAQLVNGIYGKQLGVWWNYPVTDYMPEKLALGPVHGLAKDLATEIDFFTMNPMEHAELAKISLATGADYSWNTAEYDYDKSWNIAIEQLFGELAPEMKTFANHSTRMDMRWAVGGRADAPEVRATMDSLWNKLSLGEDGVEEFAALYTEFNNMIKSADTLKAKLEPEVLEECSPNLDKLRLLGEYDKLALDMIKAAKSGDTELYASLKSQLEAKLPELTAGSKVSEKTALAFIREAIAYDPYMISPTLAKVTASSEEVSGENAPASFISDNNTGTFWHSQWSGNAPTSGHWVNLEFENEYKINKVRYVPRQNSGGSNNGVITGYRLLVSTDGVNYDLVKEGTLAENKNIKFIEFDEVTAKHVKLEVTDSMADNAANRGHFATGAELNVYGTADEDDIPTEIIVGKVRNLEVLNKTSNSVSLAWEAPITAEGLVEYIIYKDGKEVTTIPSESTTYEVSGLNKNTIYGFKVVAKYSNGKESKPQSINVRTTK